MEEESKEQGNRGTIIYLFYIRLQKGEREPPLLLYIEKVFVQLRKRQNDYLPYSFLVCLL